jgi:hypothetical protein
LIQCVFLDLLYLSQRDTLVGEPTIFILNACHDVKDGWPLDPDEQEAIRLSCSILQELPCRWTGCDIITNSVDALIQHLNREHKAACIQNGSVSAYPVQKSQENCILLYAEIIHLQMDPMRTAM